MPTLQLLNDVISLLLLLAPSAALVSLLLAGIASVGKLSPASFVQAWMGFAANGYLPTNFWSRFTGNGQHLGQLGGLAGMAVTAVLAGLAGRWQFAADVTV